MDQPATLLSPALLHALENALAGAGGGRLPIRGVRPVGGGCISRNYRIDTGRRRYFAKLAGCGKAMFAAEADGLAALARCPALVVPQVVAAGSAGDEDFLLLEWLDLEAAGDEARLGEAVAALHETAFPRFGWRCDNFIGSTPQLNGWYDDWPQFFAERRLRPQLALAAAKGAPHLAALAEPVLAGLDGLLGSHAPAPGLLHGDLWSGNKGFVGGRPALFDPAVYAGDGEADIALAELFGGFSPRFFAAYDAAHRPKPGRVARRRLYQLYHVLNHYHLFGGGYGHQAAGLLQATRRDLG